MTWVVGVANHEDAKQEFLIVRYKDYDEAQMSLASLMAMMGPYDMEEMIACTEYLIVLGDTPASAFEGDEALFHLGTRHYTFVIGKYDSIVENKGVPYTVIQDHRDCTPDHCFGDIAERN